MMNFLAHAQPVNMPQLDASLPLQILVYLFVVIIGTYVFVKFKQNSFCGHRKNTNNQLKILEAKPLGNRQHLVVVAYENQKFLLSVQTNGIQFLTELRNNNRQYFGKDDYRAKDLSK